VTVMSVTTPLFAQDLLASVTFYCNVLGFKLEDVTFQNSSIACALLVLGECQLLIYPESSRHAGSSGIREPRRKSVRLLCKRTETIEEALARIREHDVTPQDLLSSLAYAERGFSIVDPDGHVITFTEPQKV
jgi:catechol 2,3-dioxygenase-like lactoylglutathione lyase family enzyme